MWSQRYVHVYTRPDPGRQFRHRVQRIAACACVPERTLSHSGSRERRCAVSRDQQNRHATFGGLTARGSRPRSPIGLARMAARVARRVWHRVWQRITLREAEEAPR